MSDDDLNDANTATFLFEVDGVDIGRFAEVTGLEVSIETEDIVEGGQNSFVHKLPGPDDVAEHHAQARRHPAGQPARVVQRVVRARQFAANGNKLARKTAAITSLDRTGKRLRSWDFDDAYPVKWTGPTLRCRLGRRADGELEITHHGFRAHEQ